MKKLSELGALQEYSGRRNESMIRVESVNAG
jgi:hypothetical protein